MDRSVDFGVTNLLIEIQRKVIGRECVRCEAASVRAYVHETTECVSLVPGSWVCVHSSTTRFNDWTAALQI